MALHARDDLLMIREAIPEPGRYYQAHHTIVLRKGLRLDEERRYLWHELVHADRGDLACQGSAAVERSVEREAVRRAIPPLTLLWAWGLAQAWDELADLLKLPEGWVKWRVQVAHPAERAELRRVDVSRSPSGC